MRKTLARASLFVAVAACSGGGGTTGGGLAGTTTDSIPTSWTVGAWYVDPANSTGEASDNNSCQKTTKPCLTFAGLEAKWGTVSPRLRQNTTITFLSSHVDDSDPVYLSPYIENGAAVTVEGSLGTPQRVASGALSYVMGRNRPNGQLLDVGLPAGAAPGQLVVNLSKSNSRAWVYRNADGNSWYLSQPVAAEALPIVPGSAPAEVNTWAPGDAIVVYQPVAVDVVSAAPVAGPDGASTPLTFYQLKVLDPLGGGAVDAASTHSTLAITSPDVAFVESSIDRLVSISSNGFGNRPDFVNVDFSGGLRAVAVTPEAGMSVLAGQIRNAAWTLSAAALDEDLVVGATLSLSGGSYGAVYVDTGAALLPQMNDVSFSQALGAPVLWGPGSVDAITRGRLEYPPGAGGATATFEVKGLYVDQPVASLARTPLPPPSTACAVDIAGGWLCGIPVTAASLDAPVTAGGFAGSAVDPGGSTITDNNPLAQGPDGGVIAAPFQSDMLLWLRADKGVVLASDGSVAVWQDQTGLGGRDAAPLFTGMEGPLYVPNAYGEFPALRGDGTRSLMVNGGHGYAVGKQSSFFIVATSSSTGSTGTALGPELTFFTESSQGWQYEVYETAAGIQWLNASSADIDGGEQGGFPGAGAVPEDQFVFAASPTPGLHIFAETQQDGVRAAGYYDGPQIASITNPVGPSLYVMSVFGGPGDAFSAHADAAQGGYDPQGVIISAGSFDITGDIEEIVQYGRELSPQEVAEVYAYLQARWPNSNITTPQTDGGVSEAGTGEEDAAPEPATCVYEAQAPPAQNVCGDGWRDPATEECDDGLGAAGIRRGCTSTCTVLDENDIAHLGADGGLSNTPRSLGAGRHPIAAGVQTFAVATLESATEPPTVALTTFTRKGAATGVVTPMSVGSVVSDQGDPVLAPLPCDQYALAWNDVGGDGDGLGVAIRLFAPPAVPATGIPTFANVTTEFDQYSPDILWTGSSLVVAWTDTSDSTTGPDVRYRTFDATLTPTSGELALAATPDDEGDVTLAPFAGSWAAAWRDDANGLEQIQVVAGSTQWTVGPAFVPPSVTTKLALAPLDANDLLLVYSIGADPGDTGVPNAISTLQAAVLSLSAPGTVTGTPVPVNTGVEGATAASLSHAYANAVLVGSTVYATWWTSAVAGSTAGEQVWFQPVGWADAGISWSGTELLLPRLAAHRVGDQRAPALAPSTLEPEGGLVSAWDDLGKTFGLGEGNGDVVVELVPTPVLRIGAQ